MVTSEFCTNLSSMNPERKTANAVGGKTARACDSCLRKRAGWYCTADDAFLCQGCDSLVHLANSRHERVRLKTASSKQLSEFKTLDNDNSSPAWQYGFTRKARTPRQPKHKDKDKEKIKNGFPLVPEIGNEDSMFEETEAQLLYRVPVFDPFAGELCNVSNETQNIVRDYGADEACDLALDQEFAADVETLLGMRFDQESCGIEGLGLTDCKQESKVDGCYEENTVKVEEVQAAIIACHFDSGLDMSRETSLDWNFSYESPFSGEDELEEEKVVFPAETMEMSEESNKEIVEKKLLRLNYEEVILAWDNHGCPWTSGIRPQINPNDCWLDFMGISADGARYPYVGGSNIDDGREARVARYREKRRRRLFSKKIRYQVRKLNAEKRPRMKGRFVKRTSFAGESIYHP